MIEHDAKIVGDTRCAREAISNRDGLSIVNSLISSIIVTLDTASLPYTQMFKSFKKK